MAALALTRALALLQRYPGTLLLPTLLIVAAGAGINHALGGLALSKLGHFLVIIAGLLVNFLLTCAAFLCVANYTVRSESNSEQPEIRNILDSFRYPGCERLFTGLLTRFALTLVAAGGLTMLVVALGFAALKASTHVAVPRSVSGPAYLWVAIALSVVILSRWAVAVPLFVQSEGRLRAVFATSARAIQAHRGFVIVFSLLAEAVSYPLVRLTAPLHPHLSEGAARYVPHVLEIVAAHGFGAVVWTYWMIVMTMLAMRLQGGDEPVPVTPMAVA